MINCTRKPPRRGRGWCGQTHGSDAGQVKCTRRRARDVPHHNAGVTVTNTAVPWCKRPLVHPSAQPPNVSSSSWTAGSLLDLSAHGHDSHSPSVSAVNQSSISARDAMPILTTLSCRSRGGVGPSLPHFRPFSQAPPALPAGLQCQADLLTPARDLATFCLGSLLHRRPLPAARHPPRFPTCLPTPCGGPRSHPAPACLVPEPGHSQSRRGPLSKWNLQQPPSKAW